MNDNVCIFLDSRDAGGIESHVLQLATGLKSNGIRVSVCFWKNYGAHPLHRKLTDSNITWSSLEGRFGNLIRYLGRGNTGLLHTHGYKAAVMGRLAARLLGIRVINTDHAGDPGKGLVRLYTLLDRWSSFLNHANLAVSEEVSRQIKSDSIVLNNFVSIPENPKVSGSEIAFVGRLSWEKGADIYISLATQFPDHTFHVYGHGPMRSELEGRAQNVIFHGRQTDMQRVWSRIGLLVMTSRSEGLPMAALEAMSYGIPVISSAVGDLPGLISDGYNGWLADPGEVETFVRPLQQWLDLDAAPRQSMATNARALIANQYAPQVVMPQLIKIYKTVLCR